MLKTILLTLSLSLYGCASHASKSDQPSATTPEQTVKTQTKTNDGKTALKNEKQPSLPESTFKDLESFAQKKLNEKTDLEEVTKNLKVLLALDDEDPSRTGVMILSESYNKYPNLYDKAIKNLETKENKEQLNEIKTILSNHFKKGNG